MEPPNVPRLAAPPRPPAGIERPNAFIADPIRVATKKSARGAAATFLANPCSLRGKRLAGRHFQVGDTRHILGSAQKKRGFMHGILVTIS
jgi:hypothetical protein